MSLDIRTSTKFRRDYKRIRACGYNLDLLDKAVSILAEQKTLPLEYLDHPLSGNWSGFRECHIQSDWLLIYKTESKSLLLLLMRTGTHSDLFGE